MPSLKSLRTRIKSISTTKKITKAMQMIAASEVKKYKNQIENSSKYLKVITSIIANIKEKHDVKEMGHFEQKFFACNKNDPNSFLFILYTSNRGLCGGFNSSVLRKIRQKINILQKEGKTVKLIIVGQKGYDAFKDEYSEDIIKHYTNKASSKILIENISNLVIDLIKDNQFDSCFIYYSHFKNTIMQVATELNIFPFEFNEEDKDAKLHRDKDVPCEYETEGKNIIFEVISLYIRSLLTFTFLNSRASEEGSRMSSMDSATKNADKIIDHLTLHLNKTRQAIITRELIEIISSANVLNV